MLAQRRRQWVSIKPALDQRLVFAGDPVHKPAYTIYCIRVHMLINGVSWLVDVDVAAP